MEKKYKVLFFGAGKMGELVRNVLETIDNVEVTCIQERCDYLDKYDLIFSASYPHRIPQEACKLTALGAVNLHTGLLPEGRGYHPLNWAIIWGKEYTGITIHKIVDSFDAGDICLQQTMPIFKTDTIRTLRERVDDNVGSVVRAFFASPEKWMSEARKQNQAQVSYAPKRRPEDSELNLDAQTHEIYNLFRSCDPDEYPAFVMVNGTVKRIVKSVSMNGEVTYAD